MQPIDPAALALVKRFEGFVATPYRDPAGVWTIGYGETLGVTAATPPIDEPAAAFHLERRLGQFARGVDRLVKVPLSPRQLGALASFAYNVGLGAFASSTLLRKLNAGDYLGAGEEFKRWTRAGGRILPGLVNRRAAERALFLSDERKV